MEQQRQDSGYQESSPAASSGGGASLLSKLRRSRLGRQFAGWGLMVLGVVGIILPVLPGWIFIALGAVTLAPDVPFFARLLDRVAQRVPPLRGAIERVRGAPEN